VLRPTRRPARFLATAFVAIFSLALIWPAGLSAAVSARGGSVPAAAAKADRQPTIKGQGVKSIDSTRGHGSKKPLQTLKVNHLDRGSTSDPRRATPGSPRIPSPDPVQATVSGQPAATSFGGWGGLNQSNTGFEPPDPWLAVGPDDVVQTVNTTLRFRNRENVATAGDVDVFDFFDLNNFAVDGADLVIDGIGDPRWHYDAFHDRWIGEVLGWHCDTDGSGAGDDSMGFLFGAISTGNDPTGDYYHFYVLYPGFLPDFPMLGTSKDKFTLSANEFALNDTPDCTNGIPFDSASLTTFDWTDMLSFPALPDFTYYLAFGYFSLRPAIAPQSTATTIFVVGELLTVSPTNSNVAYMKITGTNAGGGTSVSSPIDLSNAGVVHSFADPPTPIQPSGTMTDGIVDRRPTDSIWQNNVLTFASTYPCVPAGSSTADIRDCGRVVQIDTSTTTPTPIQDMLIATADADTWYPGIGVSQSGTLHVVYSRSSVTEGISSYDRYQLASDDPNTLSSAVKLANGGSTSYTGDRWGDFVGVPQDPRDTNAVWQGNQYTHSSGTWATNVSELQTAGSTFVPITPVRLLDTRTGNGLSGKFSANVPRTVDIAGRAGIPANAVAITGNLTVVNQTQGGYASLTQTQIVNPATSTINFPLGDTRANNLTSPLSGTGDVSIVYKAAPGKTTNFVLDVTGYFINAELPSSHTYNVITPVRVLDTRTGAGLSGKFVANTNRTFQVAGALGIPSNAKAITGNLTVVNQSAAGYVTLATNPPPALPATSTINFPLGDTRANGVTVKLSDTGTLSAVYKAPPGKSTNLILDVTGYYLQDLNGARFVPLTPGRRMDTRFAAPQEGLSGAFSANVPRTLVIEPYQGVPANATAVTGNLTVVGQTRAGYVSLTPVATASPTTSTINFPVGDVRANGVTGPLSGSGTVGLVYKTSGGLTHLILDLTGYFR